MDYCFYGKTGTAEVYIQAEEFIDSDGNEKWDEGEEFTDLDDNGEWTDGGYSSSVFIPSFAGVFPCSNPQIVCVVSFFNPDTENNVHNKWASITAVPVAQEIFRRLKLKDKDLVL